MPLMFIWRIFNSFFDRLLLWLCEIGLGEGGDRGGGGDGGGEGEGGGVCDAGIGEGGEGWGDGG